MSIEADGLLRMAAIAKVTAEDVPSPCISVCRMNADSGLCEGCLRTLDEIARWSRMDDAGKRAIWSLIETRIEETLA